MIKIDVYITQITYYTKYGTVADDPISTFAAAACGRIDKQEVLAYTAYGSSEREAKKMVETFCKETGHIITRMDIQRLQ